MDSSSPKDINHANLAIAAYTSHPIDQQTWYLDIKDCYERALRLCLQTRKEELLNHIKQELFNALKNADKDDSHLSLSLAKLLDDVGIDRDISNEIAGILFKKGSELMGHSHYNPARLHFDLASKKFKQCDNEDAQFNCLTLLVKCFEEEGDARIDESNAVANTFYAQAIQAYRRVPDSYRETYNIDSLIKALRTKLNITGKGLLDEMSKFSIPITEDISSLIEPSISYVSGQPTPEDALLHFCGLAHGPEYNQLLNQARESLSNNFLSSLFGSSHYSSDGRLTAVVPSVDILEGEESNNNQRALLQSIYQTCGFHTTLITQGQILPASNKYNRSIDLVDTC